MPLARTSDSRFHDLLQLPDEPRIYPADAVDFLDRQAEPKGLRAAQEPVGRRRAEGGADRVLVVALAEPGDLDLVEAVPPDLERAQRLLQRFLERAADGHRFADAFHLRGQRRVGLREFLEGEARNLGDDVINGRLEARRGFARDVVLEFVEQVADGELGGDLRDGKAGGLGRQRGLRRDARVHLDDDHAAVVRVDAELDVRAAGLDAHGADHGEALVAHDLKFLVGQRLDGRDGDGVAGVDAHGIEVLDGADDDAVVGLVAHDFHLVFLPAEQRFLDEDFVHGRKLDAALGDFLKLLAVVGDAAAGAAERERGPDDEREAADLARRPSRASSRLCASPEMRHVEADAAASGP